MYLSPRGIGLLCFFLVSVLTVSGAVNTSNQLQAVARAAQDATKMFLPRAMAEKSKYGLAAGETFDSAHLEAPVRLYTFKSSALKEFQPGRALTEWLEPTGQWLVPVSVSGTNRAMIGVTENADGTCEGSSFGMAPLARKWQNIEKWFPAEKFSPRLIILPQARGYFFTVPEILPANITATLELTDTRPTLGSAEYLIQSLRKNPVPTDTDSTTNTKENKTP